MKRATISVIGGILVAVTAAALAHSATAAAGAGASADAVHAPARVTRGNETKIQYYPWGMRIWLSHSAAQSVAASVAASGNFSNAGRLPIPFPISLALRHIGCIGQFVNDLRTKDVGYGVVLDVPWWSPFWSCGLNVWSQ